MKINKNSMDQILKSFGKPASIREENLATEGFRSTRTYVWNRPNFVLRLGTFFAARPGLPEIAFYLRG
jgi:hypothetical protein